VPLRPRHSALPTALRTRERLCAPVSPPLASILTAPAAPHRNQSALEPYYTAVRVYILVCDWVPARQANAQAICEQLAAHGVPCSLVPALRGDNLTAADVSALEAEGVASTADSRPPPRLAAVRRALPRFLSPLFGEALPNQLNAKRNWRALRALGNTVGTVRCLQAMRSDALASPESAGSTLFVYVEDDAVIEELDSFAERLSAAMSQMAPGSWDLASLSPPPGMCERSAWLPPPWRVRSGEVMAPRFSFSRTTGVAFSSGGVQALLGLLPVDNVIDMWLRRLMRQGRLRVRIHCGRLVRFGEVAATQARRQLRETG